MSEKDISAKMQDIMERIKNRREELSMSYQTLSDKVGISKSTLQRYETGYIKNMPVDKLEDIADALNVSPAYLMGWEQKWDMEAQQFEDKINAFFYQLRALGWTYEWSYNDKMYIFSNGITSTKITAEEYGILVDQSEEFCKRQLQKLLLKSSSLLNAAHEDNPTPEQKAAADSIMEDDSEWE